MTREEFERIKEAEKEHLRALKKLKQTVRSLEQRKSVGNALTDMASSTGSLLDKHTEMVEKLAEETAMQEARFEVALESVEGDEVDPARQAAQDEADLAKIEKERQQSRAQDLVRQVKLQMGGTASQERSGSTKTEAGERTVGRNETHTEQDRAGAASPREKSADDAETPEKTIGRMRRR